MSVLICIPTGGNVHHATMTAVWEICARGPAGSRVEVVQGFPADHSRTRAVRSFLRSSHTHLFFLDSDVVPPVTVLASLLEVDHPLVCGLYPLQLEGELCVSAGRRVSPTLYGFLRDFPDEPFEVDTAGLGCCLIERRLFEQIDPPWFAYRERPDGRLELEDQFFFERCAEVGVKPIAVPQVLCTHHRVADLLPIFEEVRALRRARRAHDEQGQTASRS